MDAAVARGMEAIRHFVARAREFAQAYAEPIQTRRCGQRLRQLSLR
jgi:hypothetical protein